MAGLSWPLEMNKIRGETRNNTFGWVRSGGQQRHQGWDLEAAPGTPCFAIANGVIRWAGHIKKYGTTIVLEFEYQGSTLYATYAHLSAIYVRKDAPVTQGDMIGLTGRTGNASTLPLSEAHLHFAIHTMELPQIGLTGYVNPMRLYGFMPIDTIHGDYLGKSYAIRSKGGLRVPGVNAP